MTVAKLMLMQCTRNRQRKKEKEKNLHFFPSIQFSRNNKHSTFANAAVPLPKLQGERDRVLLFAETKGLSC